MRLTQVHIKNYRAIKDCTITFRELTALVGENNSGKTAILRALNSFFNFEFEEKDFLNEVHKYAPKTKTSIIVVFSDVPNREIYRELIDSNQELRIEFTYKYSLSHKGRRIQCLKDGVEKQLEAQFISEIKKDIDFVYIPARRSSKNIEWGESSVFTKLVTMYLDRYTKNRDTLSPKAVDAGNKIVSQALKVLATDLSTLVMSDDFGQFQIDYSETIDYKVFLDKLGLNVLDCTKKNARPVSEYGSGVKSLSVIALHRMIAKLNNVSIILGIEEPETNLHPQAQRMLINSLKNSRQSCETQAVFATHSTVIVDALKHEEIVLVRKVHDETKGFHSESKQLDDSFWHDHGIEEFKHYTFFHYRNSDFFFARFVILVESSTDAAVIEKLLQGKEVNDLNYVSIVNLNGISNIKYPFFLLRDLGIPFCAVVDMDFFTPYKNGEIETSRNPRTSLPEYTCEVKNDIVIKAIFNTNELMTTLADKLKGSYSSVIEFTKNYGFLPMQYCLEMDLTTSKKAQEEFFNSFNLEGEDRNTRKLLIDKKKAIKQADVILSVLDKLEPKDYPISYKKIRNYLAESIARNC